MSEGGGFSTSPAALRPRWEKVLSLYRAAQERFGMALRGGNQEDRMATAGDLDELRDKLLETPTPDASALLAKLQIMWPELTDAEATHVPGQQSVVDAVERLVAADAMPPNADVAWEAYSEAARAKAAGESDPFVTDQQRVDRALDAGRAWRRLCAAMSNGSAPAVRLTVVRHGKEAA